MNEKPCALPSTSTHGTRIQKTVVHNMVVCLYVYSVYSDAMSFMAYSPIAYYYFVPTTVLTINIGDFVYVYVSVEPLMLSRSCFQTLFVRIALLLNRCHT